MTKYFTLIFLFIFLSLFCWTKPVFSQTVKDSLRLLLTEAPSDTTKLRLLNQLHAHYRYQSRGSRNIDSAEHYANEAYLFAKKMSTENIAVYNAIRAKATFTIQEKKDPINAIKLYQEAILVAENRRDTLSIGQGYFSIGNIYTSQHLTDKALEYYSKSLYLYEKKNSKTHISMSCNVLGYTYRVMSKMDSAEFFFKKAIKTSLETPQKYRLESYLYNIIDFYESQHKTDKARDYQELAFAYRNLPFESMTMIAKQLNMGKYYQSKKEYTKAVQYFQSVIDTTRSNKTLSEDELVVEAYRSLSTCYRDMNDFKNAYFFFEKQKTYEDSTNKIVFSRDTAFKIVELQAAFNVERAQISLKTQRNYSIGLLILSLSIIGIALLIFRNNRIKEQTNRQLKIQGQLLEQQKNELSTLNSTKDRLFSLIAHDIRAPLSSLTTLLTLWDAKIISGEKFDEISGKVRSNLHYLRISLDNLLVWSTAQLKGIKPKPEKISVHEVVNNEVCLLNDTAENKGVQLIYEAPEAIYWAETDKVQLSIVVRNILSNAIKFTHKGGQIHIKIHPESDFYKISITDTGIGMPKDLRDHLFDKDIDNIRRGTANEKGTGLGLSVAKEFVEANGGTIQVASEEGNGTKIGFTVVKKPF